jgi:hypothetical protein
MTSPFVGSWSYRSFQNNPDLAVPFDALRFGAGTLALTEPTFGQVSGTLGGPGWSLALAGHYTYGNPNHARFQGSGDIDGEAWVYDYVGYLVPAWPNGIDQAPAIAGLRQSHYSSHSSEARVTSQRHMAALIPGWKAGSAGRDTRTFAAYRDFDGALPAIVGSVIRTLPHSNGQAAAGYVASFVAVRQP